MPDETTTLADYLAWWLETRVARRWRPATIRAYRGSVTRHINPALGHLAVGALTVQDVQGWLDKQAEDYAPATVYRRHATLSSALRWAVGSGVVDRNVCEVARPQARPQTRARALSVDEARALARACESEWYGPVILAALLTGMRVGELIALRWPNVESQRDPRRIHVFEALSEKDRPGMPSAPKNGGTRTIPVSPTLRGVLIEHRERVQRWQQRPRVVAFTDRNLVFPSQRGSPGSRRGIATALERVCQRASVPRITFHELRHTYATLLIEGGRPLTDVQRLLGHRYYSTTADYYVHLTEQGRDEIGAAIDGALDLGGGLG